MTDERGGGDLGEPTPLADITGSLIDRLVAKRRADRVGPATINRTVLEPLRRVLNRAKLEQFWIMKRIAARRAPTPMDARVWSR